MQLKELSLQNFRCFKQLNLTFDAPIVFIKGDNGAGKTALLEAIYYLCYLRSFRTYSSRELINFDSDNFFVRGLFSDRKSDTHELSIGVTHQKKLVKLDQKPINSFQDLNKCVKVISLSESDLQVIQAGPEHRRSFIDSYIFLNEPSFTKELCDYKKILSQRNALLQRFSFDKASYLIWTEKLWHQTQKIEEIRSSYLQEIEGFVQEEATFIPNASNIQLKYCCKRCPGDTFKQFLLKNPSLSDEERLIQRSLFGAHLDDISIKWRTKNARLYASRGQQKLVMLLLKIAKVKGLIHRMRHSILLLDDFVTDFDEERIQQILPLLHSLNCPLFFTCAQGENSLERALKAYKVQTIILDRSF